ncbi:hypothetical protein [Leptospira santarosai]|uniref:hypothetical protein n=1 Tax=Leptospira santarosai TaxID=28183 RepID=UPI0026E3393F|nr:hypothetical protein [Leptospira santarosai]MDO6384152.1 hypothetical protein [Leptospira santarosai]
MSENPTATIFKPFLDRVSHPILSWVILFNIIFNYEKIIKLTLVIAGKATTKPDISNPLVQYIPLYELTQFSYCSFFSAVFIGTIIGIIWPILDKLYQQHISKQAVLLEDAIANQKNSSLLGQIAQIQTSSDGKTDELLSLKNHFCSEHCINLMRSLSKFNKTSAIEISIHPCEQNVEVANFAEIAINGKLKLATANESTFGLVISKVTDDLCVVLVKGTTSSQNILNYFKSEHKYRLVDGKATAFSGDDDNWIAYREGSSLKVKKSNIT